MQAAEPVAQMQADAANEAREVAGFDGLATAAKLPIDVSQALLRDLVDVGAVGVEELTSADWQSLPSWRELRMLERRRLMQALLGPRASWGE